MCTLKSPQDQRNHRFSSRKDKITPIFCQEFLQSNQQFSQVSRQGTEESVEDSATTKHINQSMSFLEAPTPSTTQKSRANQDRFLFSNPQSPQNNVGLREQENTFNQFL